jgi:hypothetical protein
MDWNYQHYQIEVIQDPNLFVSIDIDKTKSTNSGMQRRREKVVVTWK